MLNLELKDQWNDILNILQDPNQGAQAITLGMLRPFIGNYEEIVKDQINFSNFITIFYLRAIKTRKFVKNIVKNKQSWTKFSTISSRRISIAYSK